MRYRLQRAWILAVAAWTGVAGCGRADGSTASAGLGHADFLDTLPRVLVDTTPVLTLGRVEPEDDEHTLVTVTWAALPGDSLLVLGDTGARRVGVYGLDGAFRRWLGRVGDGPGEFRSPKSGGLTSDGKVWIFDLSRQRVLIFEVGGELVEAVDLRSGYGSGSNPNVLGVDDAGGVWLQLVSGSPGTADVQSGQRYRPDVTIRRITRDSSAVVWAGGGNESVFKIEEFGTSSRSGGLAPMLLTTLLADELVLTRSDSTSLDRVTAGGVLRPWLDYPAAHVPVGDRYPRIQGPDRYDWLPEALGFVPGSRGSTWLMLQSPDSLPPLVHLTASGATEYLASWRWGRPIMYVGDRYVVTWGVSNLGVQSIQVYELVR